MSDGENWEEAARRYPELREKQKQDEKRAIKSAAAQLQNFLYSREGMAAIKLLRASGKRVVFATQIGKRDVMIWFLGGGGLQQEWHGPLAGHWMISLREDQAVEAAFRMNATRPVHPKELMSWLRANLNSIAAGATEGGKAGGGNTV